MYLSFSSSHKLHIKMTISVWSIVKLFSSTIEFCSRIWNPLSLLENKLHNVMTSVLTPEWAAVFPRLNRMWIGDMSVFVTCTEAVGVGGDMRLGMPWESTYYKDVPVIITSLGLSLSWMVILLETVMHCLALNGLVYLSPLCSPAKLGLLVLIRWLWLLTFLLHNVWSGKR